MLSQLKFLKFWSFIFLELKYWEQSTWYFYSLLSLKIMFNSKSEDFLGLPNLFLNVLNKDLNRQFLVQNTLFKNKKYNFRTFFLFSLFFFNTDFLLHKNTALGSKTLMLYSNENLFYMDFLLKIDYGFFLKFSNNPFLNKDVSSFMGLPSPA